MNIEDIDLNKGIKLSIIVGISLISFSFFYYFVIFLPSKERIKTEQQKQEILIKQENAQREGQIRQTCSLLAEQAAVEFYKQRAKENPYLYPLAEGRYLKPDYDSYYKKYLREYGIEE